MTHSNLRKKKAVPYPIVQKQSVQQWSYLKQLSSEQKRVFRNKFRFFSLEYKRPFSKRIVWQMATHKPLVPKQMQTNLSFNQRFPQRALRQEPFSFLGKTQLWKVSYFWGASQFRGISQLKKVSASLEMSQGPSLIDEGRNRGLKGLSSLKGKKQFLGLKQFDYKKRSQLNKHLKRWRLSLGLKPFESLGPKALGLLKRTQETSQLTKHSVKSRRTFSLTPKLYPFTQSWTVFRSLLFGNLRTLNNPSIVPGSVWLVKRKRLLVARMRAFRAMRHLLGNSGLKFVNQTFQKLWKLSAQTTPSLWSLARGIDSLQTSVFLKSNFVSTLTAASNLISQGNCSLNGRPIQKSRSFIYPGDCLRVTLKEPFYEKEQHIDPLKMGLYQQPLWFDPQRISSGLSRLPLQHQNLIEKDRTFALGTLLTYGPNTERSTPINAVNPFVWLNSFYSSGKVFNTFGQRKRIARQRRFFKGFRTRGRGLRA